MTAHPRRQPYIAGWGTPPGLGSGDKSDLQRINEWVDERRTDIFGYDVMLMHAWKWCGIRYDEAWTMNLGYMLEILSLNRP